MAYNSILIPDHMCYLEDKNNINLHKHVSLDKQAAKEIGKGLNTTGSILGLGTTMAGVCSAVAKCLVKSAMPPIQKAGVVLGAG